MRKIMKRLVALAAVTTMVLTSLVGCATGSDIDNSEVVATVGDSEITAGVANFYLRYQQSGMEELYETYFGKDFWSMVLTDGGTYAAKLKNTVMTTLHEFYVLEDHMADYNVTISDEEFAAIEKAAEAFIAANTADVNKNISAEKEIVVEVLKLFTINEKMYKAMTADVDQNVSDAQAAQKRLRYYSKSKTDIDGKELTEKELEEARAELQDFLDKSKAKGGMKAYGDEISLSTYTLTFDSDSTNIHEDVVKAADVLGEGEFAELIETDTFIYAIQLESLFDEEATDAKKDTIIEERELAAYQAVAEKWLEETKIEVNSEVWAKVEVEVLKVLVVEEETEE